MEVEWMDVDDGNDGNDGIFVAKVVFLLFIYTLNICPLASC